MAFHAADCPKGPRWSSVPVTQAQVLPITTLAPLAIQGCGPVPVHPNRDDRGCLFEIFREEWAGAFRTV